MLSTNLKNFRKQRKLTQKELAEKVGIAEITIRKYEKGEREPNLETIEKLAYALNITPYELLCDSNQVVSQTHKAINEAANNLSLLTESHDESIKDLAFNLECLIENVTANVLNKNNLPKTWHDYHNYVNEMNRLLNKIAIIANPVQYINHPRHIDLIKSIDDFMDYKLTQYNYEEED